jgi:small-conductance mechanosensitive channel
MVQITRVIRSVFTNQWTGVMAIAVLVIGLFAGYAVWYITRRILQRLGVPDLVEGTVFERSVRGLGTSTIGVLSTMAALFVYVGSVVIALSFVDVLDTRLVWSQLTTYLPQLFIAVLALIAGFIVGDKTKLVVSDRLRSVKLPQVGLLPEIVKYSIFFIGGLIALAQLGVATDALLVLLGVYLFGIVFIGGLAFKDLLTAGGAGVYLLLTEPYSIGDRVRIDDHEGIVQEVDVFVTHIESDGEEYIIPNQRVLQSSIVRIRD